MSAKEDTLMLKTAYSKDQMVLVKSGSGGIIIRPDHGAVLEIREMSDSLWNILDIPVNPIIAVYLHAEQIACAWLWEDDCLWFADRRLKVGNPGIVPLNDLERNMLLELLLPKDLKKRHPTVDASLLREEAEDRIRRYLPLTFSFGSVPNLRDH